MTLMCFIFTSHSKQMDPTVICLVGLLLVLMVGQYYTTEYFSTDSSGNTFNLSLSDLLALIGKSGISNYSSASTLASMRAASDAALAVEQAALAQKSKGLEAKEIRRAVRRAVRDEMERADKSEIDEGCIDSFAQQQGTQFMKYIPGKNPADYIRKDSIPCYGCNIP